MLLHLGRALVGPVASFALKAELLTNVFRYIASLIFYEERKMKENSEHGLTENSPSFNDLDEDKRAAFNMNWDFSHIRMIDKQSFLMTSLGCSRNARYKSMLAKA